MSGRDVSELLLGYSRRVASYAMLWQRMPRSSSATVQADLLGRLASTVGMVSGDLARLVAPIVCAGSCPFWLVEGVRPPDFERQLLALSRSLACLAGMVETPGRVAEAAYWCAVVDCDNVRASLRRSGGVE